jgi:hypothetical protein
MKHIKLNFIFPCALTALLSLGVVHTAFAEDAGEIEKQEAAEAKSPASQETWSAEVKTKYSLTDDQMKAMQTAGLHGPQLAIAAELAKASGKSIDQVIQMRTTEKMGWGKIAKTLGLPPGSIGQSVASLRHDLHEKREDKREEKKEKRDEKMQRKKDDKEDRAELKKERREDKCLVRHRFT